MKEKNPKRHHRHKKTSYVQLVLSGALLCRKGREKIKELKKTVPQSTENSSEIHDQKRIGRENPSPPYKIYVASHVEVSSANAVPGGFARTPFHDPASALYPPPLPRGPMGTTHPPIIHTSGHLVPPPRRSARGQAGLLSILIIWGESISASERIDLY